MYTNTLPASNHCSLDQNNQLVLMIGMEKAAVRKVLLFFCNAGARETVIEEELVEQFDLQNSAPN